MKTDLFPFLFLSLLFTLFAGAVPAQLTGQKPVLTVLFYNAENYFHPSDDTLTADDEFTPGGERHWTFARYHAKRSALAKIIYAAGSGGPPDITGLCEVENRQVLEDLIRHPLLLPAGLRILHHDSPDPRGIDIGVLYRPDRVKVLAWEHRPVVYGGSVLRTREIVRLTVRIPTGDTAEIFFNHWTSRYGGMAVTDEKRMAIVRQLAAWIDSLETQSPGHLIIAGGDLNDGSDSGPVNELLSCGRGVERPARLQEQWPGGAEGSYKYQGRWELIDHVFTGGNTQGYRFAASLFCLPVMLVPDEKFNGEKPFRTYTGFEYSGGFSDHLPLRLSVYRAD
ncbi:MAG: endonuclease/exonuclease/phosphatase family protein [Bacteroidota bacterium]